MKPWLLLALSGCALVATIPPDQSRGQEGELVRLHVPAELHFGCDLDDHEQQTVEKAARYWNDAVGVTLFTVHPECGIEPSDYEDLGASVVLVSYVDILKRDPRPGHEHYLETAATLQNTQNGLIYSATVHLYRSWRELGGGMEGQSIIRHELGHVLGLEHTRDPRCLMYFSNQFDTPEFATPACDAELKLVRSIYK